MYIQAHIVCSVTHVPSDDHPLTVTLYHFAFKHRVRGVHPQSTYQVTIMWPPCDVHVLFWECNEQCTFNLRQLNSCIFSSGVVQAFISYPISYFRCLKAVLLVLSTCLRLHQLADMALHQEIFSLVASQLVRNTSTTIMYMYLHYRHSCCRAVQECCWYWGVNHWCCSIW